MQRISIKDLERRVSYLNTLTGNPQKPWIRNDDGKLVAQIGNYHLSQAYGGVCIHQMLSSGGGVTTPIFGGHVPKREAYQQLNAYIAGIENQKRGEA